MNEDEKEKPAEIVRERAPHGEAARADDAAADAAPASPVDEEETAYESATELGKALGFNVHVKKKFTAAYEHPWAVRMAHWLNAVSLFVLAGTGLRIFRAFPSFGEKIPQEDFLHVPTQLTLGGWLGGALQWHFTFMWIFVGTGIFYLFYQFISGHYKTVVFMPRDIKGVWPMVRHYFLFGPQPTLTEQYNPLQKLAYTSAVGFGVLATLTGMVLYKPAQFSFIAWIFGGYHMARVWHFAALCGFLAFIPGHLLMVALHGWNNFYSMLGGWKKNPEYLE